LQSCTLPSHIVLASKGAEFNQVYMFLSTQHWILHSRCFPFVHDAHRLVHSFQGIVIGRNLQDTFNLWPSFLSNNYRKAIAWCPQLLRIWRPETSQSFPFLTHDHHLSDHFFSSRWVFRQTRFQGKVSWFAIECTRTIKVARFYTKAPNSIHQLSEWILWSIETDSYRSLVRCVPQRWRGGTMRDPEHRPEVRRSPFEAWDLCFTGSIQYFQLITTILTKINSSLVILSWVHCRLSHLHSSFFTVKTRNLPAKLPVVDYVQPSKDWDLGVGL